MNVCAPLCCSREDCVVGLDSLSLIVESTFKRERDAVIKKQSCGFYAQPCCRTERLKLKGV